jgi:YegS/Rv2252/BmrU family lipid kinase
MAEATTSRTRRIFVILNPNSGGCTVEDVRQALGRHFACEDGACKVHEIVEGDDAAALARAAVEREADVIVAAGGDGSVSAVANGLIGSEVPLGIIPLGTANVLARDLGVPLDLDGACALLAGAHATRGLDAMRVRGRVFFTQVGVGLDALMIRDTKIEAKKRFGRAAYLWTALVRLVGFQPRRFEVEVDGQTVQARASEVLVANSGILGQPPFRWGPDIRLDDGRLDVCIIRARTFLDYARLAWKFVLDRHKSDPKVRYLVAERSVAIAAKTPLPVQADGEIVGETPVQVEVVPGAVCVIAPENEPTGA